jgi:hypothetical protein
MTNYKMTPRQKEVFDFLTRFLKEQKRYSRLLDVQRHFDVTYGGAKYLMNDLLAIGKVEKVERGVYRPK